MDKTNSPVVITVFNGVLNIENYNNHRIKVFIDLIVLAIFQTADRPVMKVNIDYVNFPVSNLIILVSRVVDDENRNNNAANRVIIDNRYLTYGENSFCAAPIFRKIDRTPFATF